VAAPPEVPVDPEFAVAIVVASEVNKAAAASARAAAVVAFV
jgi:hypothetical protein